MYIFSGITLRERVAVKPYGAGGGRITRVLLFNFVENKLQQTRKHGVTERRQEGKEEEYKYRNV